MDKIFSLSFSFPLALLIARPAALLVAAVAHRRFLFYDSQIPAADKYSKRKHRTGKQRGKPKKTHFQSRLELCHLNVMVFQSRQKERGKEGGGQTASTYLSVEM